MNRDEMIAEARSIIAEIRANGNTAFADVADAMVEEKVDELGGAWLLSLRVARQVLQQSRSDLRGNRY